LIDTSSLIRTLSLSDRVELSQNGSTRTVVKVDVIIVYYGRSGRRLLRGGCPWREVTLIYLSMKSVLNLLLVKRLSCRVWGL
jgi:hypothetical protein